MWSLLLTIDRCYSMWDLTFFARIPSMRVGPCDLTRLHGMISGLGMSFVFKDFCASASYSEPLVAQPIAEILLSIIL